MIIRIWKGTTTHENSEKYQRLLKEVVFPLIQNKSVSGYRGIRLLRNIKQDEVEFITIMTFDNLEAVRGFAGEDYEKSYVIGEAKALLQSYDGKAAHYELAYDSTLI